MRTIIDPPGALTLGLAAIRAEFAVPEGFAPEVLATAALAAKRKPTQHADRTDRAFVTLDPATSTDLDQAFAIEPSGRDLLLHYAIADVAWFVSDGDAIDREAWRRGETIYLPDGRAGLYPPALSEDAASLLPSGPKPAVIFTVRVAPDGSVRLDGAERALIRSRAKLAYDSVTDADLPTGFAELHARIVLAEERRGASRVDPPAQEVSRVDGGTFALAFTPRLKSEEQNAALSLASNMAVADALAAAGTGLFRVMPAPDERAIVRLRHTAAALDLSWPAEQPLSLFNRSLTGTEPASAAFMLALRRASPGAGYASFRPGERPWHAAVAATYVHATAPLRRLADRYVVQAALAIANGHPVPEPVAEAFERLPPVMARADAVAGRINRAVIDLAETVVLASQVGKRFGAVVTDADDDSARIQLRDVAVVARLSEAGLQSGDELEVTLVSVDTAKRQIAFRH